ncbi:helix-turn-helix domain-containing protein [Shewanella baltica]|uniref:helix-turn-helix domain-containing protein n=1 Tax=Shewanella baltica TaxID=62322 RepID=UPI00217DB787|nr:helix-turn-helix transcriptional regulator [Shewanella baltica]MCS6190689.1 helix-turn-helix transcriptional regulator [Shewanella baltica]
MSQNVYIGMTLKPWPILLDHYKIDEVGLGVNHDGIELEAPELSDTQLDIATHALNGNVGAVISQGQMYLSMAKRKAYQAKGGDSISRIDQNSKAAKKVVISSVNLTMACPEASPSEILKLAINRCKGNCEDLNQYKRFKGSKYIRGVVALSELTELQKHQLVINSALTVSGLIAQVKKLCDYLPVRLKKSNASKVARDDRRNRHLEILSSKEKGLTQKEVASLVGVSERTVKRYWNKQVLDE